MNYNTLFILKLLEDIIRSGKDTVVVYPAGTGKTMAIYDYIVKHWKEGRKIIYIAPTVSLLDDLYKRLEDNRFKDGLSVFNYHSRSEDYLQLKKLSGNDKENLRRRIQGKIRGSNVILITHKRMMFEPPNRFIDDMGSDDTRAICFIDESVEPCVIATMNKLTLISMLVRAGLCDPNISEIPKFSEYNYLTGKVETFGDKDYRTIARMIYAEFEKWRTGNGRLRRPSEFNIELSQTCGFENKEYDPIIEARLSSLYNLIATQIAKGAFVSDDSSKIFLEIPVALHTSWKNNTGVQTIIMDATADITDAVYPGYEIVKLPRSSWNFDKLRNFAIHGNGLSKTSLKESLNDDDKNKIEEIFNKFSLKHYNKIYVVCSVVFLEFLNNYLRTKYPEYKIVYSVANAKKLEDDPDTDYNSDEEYQNIEGEKIIYLSNYGRTRGSNVFRECECVVQVGTYRYPPQVVNRIKIIYPGLLTDDLPMANLIQEVYRGRIRCDQPMDTITIMDEELYKAIRERLPEFKMIDKSDMIPSWSATRVRKPQKVRKDLYEVYTKLRIRAEDGVTSIPFDEVMKICGTDNPDTCIRTIKRISEKEELKYLVENNENFGRGKDLNLTSRI